MEEIIDEHSLGTNRIINKKRMASWFPALWMSFGLLFLIFGFDQIALLVLLGGALANGALTLIWLLSACPRCGHRFYSVPSTPGFLWHTTKCRHCGLGLFTDNANDPGG